MVAQVKWFLAGCWVKVVVWSIVYFLLFAYVLTGQ